MTNTLTETLTRSPVGKLISALHLRCKGGVVFLQFSNFYLGFSEERERYLFTFL